MKRQIIAPDKEYTFHDYFNLRASSDDVLAYFGYEKQNGWIDFPRFEGTLINLEALHARLEEHVINISLENELTRREFLIAPVMSEVRHITKAKLRSEYWFEYNYQLKGWLDYFIKKELQLLVVEAKNADLTRGFTQLAVELIALDKAEETDKAVIFGAVSTGQEWRFSLLNRQTKNFTQDLKTFTLPQDVETILRILAGILEAK